MAFVLAGGVASIVGPGIVAPEPVLAQTDDEPVPTLDFGALELTLVDHQIDVLPGGDVTLVYRIDGRLADAELLFIDTVNAGASGTTSTTSTTGTTDSTRPPGADDADDPGSVDDSSPIPISADVVVAAAMDETGDLIGRLGPTVVPSSFDTPIDGILLPDVRPSIDVGDDGTVILRLVVGTDTAPSQADRLGLDAPGLYPLLVRLRVDGEVIARHGTVINRVGDGPQPPPIGLAAIAAVPQPTTIPDDDETAVLVEAAARLTEFAAVTSMPLTLSIPPTAVEGLTVGTSAGAIVAESLRDDALQSLPATPFDVSSAVAIDRDDAFVRQLTVGEERVQDAVPGVPVRRDVWLVDRALSTEAAALMRTLGVRLLVMTDTVASASLIDAPDPLPRDRLLRVPLGDGTTLPVMVIDDESSPFTTDASDEVLGAASATEWAIEYLARLRLGVDDDAATGVDRLDGRGRLLATPDLRPLDPRLLEELVRLAPRTRLVSVTDASSLVSTVAEVDLGDAGPSLPDLAGPSLVGRVETIDAAGLVVANVSSMLPDDDARPGQWTDMLDTLVSTAYTDDEVAFVVDAVQDAADRLTGSVRPPDPFELTLTSRRATIPIEITNTADEPLRVRVELVSERLRFPDGDPEVVLAPDGVTEIEIPVEARTNGTTAVEVRVVTPLGGPLTEPVRVTTRVQALSGIAQLVTAVLVILLLTWWFNHWRAKRRTGATDPVASVSA
ncbi:MAG: DUF6049 family protein [Actinomycetota bacterium]